LLEEESVSLANGLPYRIAQVGCAHVDPFIGLFAVLR
jgi:hypothetical protein